jgi:putative ABC transport system substrate-binding protein
VSREAKGVRKTKRRQTFGVVLGALLFALCVSAEAQQVGGVPRIGFVAPLSPAAEASRIEAFKQGLRDFGYVERKNILVEYRYAEGKRDRVSTLVGELVRHKVDVLIAEGLSTAQAAKQATRTIPIVVVTANDPVASGLVDSLARPGGNVTGLTRLTRDLSGKRLELLKEVLPGLARVGILWDAGNEAAGVGFKAYETAAPVLKLQLQSVEVRGPSPDLEGAFHAAFKGRAQGLAVILNPLTRSFSKQIAQLAVKNLFGSLYEISQVVEDGGLMSYASNDTDNFRRAAYYVDKILKGAKPAEIPVEQPTKFEFVINLKTAKQIGLTIPPNVLARADRVMR